MSLVTCFLCLLFRLIVADSSTTTTISTSTSTPTTEISPTTVVIIEEQSFSWDETSTENPIVFKVDEGYFISVTVSGVNMEDGDYVLIQGGDSRDTSAVDGLIFANTVRGPLKYLFQTSMVYGYFDNSHSVNNSDKFVVQFQQIEGVTTTESTSTTTAISVPPTVASDSVYLTVNISGRDPGEYKNQSVVEAFKNCVVIMAKNYCNNQNIHITQSITTDYVMISRLTHCPYDWPASSTCVSITFKLPIFYDESVSKWDGYQMKTEHLENMWLRYADLDEQCFQNNGFEIYEEPDIEGSIMWWAIGISLAVVFFVLLLWFLRIFSSRIKTLKRRRRHSGSDTSSIISRQMDSVSSMCPHYLQETPKLFEN